MIVFEKIRWKNFLSTGNAFTEVTINDSPNHLIIGSNGAGKSTLLDALCFGLFNKPFRKINKPQLANSINERECVVEIEFSIGSVGYKIVRGIKPGIFEIYRNGALIDQDAANKDYQKYLEQSILKFNFKSFTQVVILGSSTFVPFMQLPAAHRREVIEDLLDIQIFSRMNVLLKDRVKDVKETVKNCEHEYNLHESQVNIQRSSCLNLQKMNKEYISKLQTSFNANEEQQTINLRRVSEAQEEINILTEEVAAYQFTEKKYDQLRDMRVKIQQNFDKAQKEIAFYADNDTCPTCSQGLTEDVKKSKTALAEDRLVKLGGGITEIGGEIKKVTDNLKNYQLMMKQINELQYEITTLQKQNGKMLKENSQIIAQVNEDRPDITKEEEKLQQFESELQETAERCAKVNQDATNLLMVSSLLKDTGIKSKIISRFIPVINKQINKYLQSMDFFVNFTLDEGFNEIIKSRYRDEFSYASFSEGEKQKIDLALLFTWRDIAKMKNSASTNLLILDEVFDSSLDSTATDELMKILKGLDKHTNLFVISHKGEVLLDKFDTTLQFEKVNDFSKLQTDATP
jgi:DNA repair exonuclease SbcCD ATPase subunit